MAKLTEKRTDLLWAHTQSQSRKIGRRFAPFRRAGGTQQLAHG